MKILSTILGNIDEQAMDTLFIRRRSAGVRLCMAHPSGKERPTIEYMLWLFVAGRVSSREQGCGYWLAMPFSLAKLM